MVEYIIYLKAGKKAWEKRLFQKDAGNFSINQMSQFPFTYSSYADVCVI